VKLIFDLFPVILFFVAYKFGTSDPAAAADLATRYLGTFVSDGAIAREQAPILLATAAAIVASVLQVGYVLARGRKVEPVLWMSVAVILVFGGATIWLHDETFIKWKPSILYWLFAVILLGGRLFWNRNLLRSLLGTQIDVPPPVWDRMLWLWTTFFVAIGIVNLVVAYSFSTDTWVNFKLFGLFGLTLAFALGVGFWLARHMKEEAPGAKGVEDA
jgi:intracellular septation protein